MKNIFLFLVSIFFASVSAETIVVPAPALAAKKVLTTRMGQTFTVPVKGKVNAGDITYPHPLQLINITQEGKNSSLVFQTPPKPKGIALMWYSRQDAIVVKSGDNKKVIPITIIND